MMQDAAYRVPSALRQEKKQKFQTIAHRLDAMLRELDDLDDEVVSLFGSVTHTSKKLRTARNRVLEARQDLRLAYQKNYPGSAAREERAS